MRQSHAGPRLVNFTSVALLQLLVGQAIWAHAASLRMVCEGDPGRPHDPLDQQIALALSSLASVRRAHETVRSDITQRELYLATDILPRSPSVHVYEDPRLPERDMLRARLLTLGAERRRLILNEAESLGRLHERLLELLLKREALGRD